MDLVDTVGAPVGHFAAGVRPPTHPAELEIRVEGTQFGRAAPHVPVIAVGDRLFGQAFVAGRTGIVDRLHDFELADAAAADEVAAVVVDFHRALLSTDLKHGAVAAGGVDNRAAFADVGRERLLSVDVQTCLAARMQGSERPWSGVAITTASNCSASNMRR
ncbi:MAG: hypothetical protein R3C10_20810 [Pirellulales bacterium]